MRGTMPRVEKFLDAVNKIENPISLSLIQADFYFWSDLMDKLL
jgi:hypothetical protein